MKISSHGNKRYLIPAGLSLCLILCAMFMSFRDTKITRLKLSTKQLNQFKEELAENNQREIENKKE